MTTRNLLLLLIVFSIFSSTIVNGLKQHLDLRDDARKRIFIDNFGFEAGGFIKLNISNLTLHPSDEKAEIGFVIEKTQTDATRFFDESDDQVCTIPDPDLRIKDFKHQPIEYIIKDNMEGFYNIFFVKCSESKHSFHLLIDLHNEVEGKAVYLSAGEAPLTTVYSLLFLLYATTIFAWLFGSMRGHDKKVFFIHYLMTLLFILKALSILFKAIELHYLKLVGFAGTWAAIYYVFSFLKGVMMFMVIALVGTGWTFIKPFLADKDKKIFLFVIPLQILDNIALVIIEETNPGSLGWFTWKDIFRLVDIVCCGAILVPIIWSIKHLKQAALIDGKAKRNMEKLKLFRQFYLIVVSYIYFTRIIVYLLDATLPFRWVWLGDLFTEAATFAFFCTVGHKFRPIANNPHFTMDDDDENQNDNNNNNNNNNTPKNTGSNKV